MSLFKFFLMLGAALLVLSGLGAQAPDWMWVKQAGGAGNDNCFNIATDTAGNSYVCGWFQGTSTFGTVSLTSDSASLDIFVGKLDAAGNWLWVRQAGGATNDYGRGIAIDGAGNVYLTGSFTGSAAFGAYPLANNGYPDIFVAKLDSQGNWLWAQKAGGTAEDEGWDIAVDTAGNSYLTGYIRAVVQFGSFQLETDNFTFDLFVASIDPDGNWLWASKGGGSGVDSGYGIALDNAGFAYVTGYYEGNAIFGGVSLACYGTQPDIFVGQISSNGVWMWGEHGGGTGYDNGIAIATDNSGNSYVAGFYYNSATFGAHTLTATSGNQMFVGKLNNAGIWQWAQQPGGTVTGSANGIALDNLGNIYISGTFSGSPVFGPVTVPPSQGSDVFAAKLDASGSWLWGQKAGGTQEDSGEDIGVDSSGNSCVVGNLNGYVHFGTIVINGFGFTDAFVAKLSPGGVPVDDHYVPALDGYALSASPNPFRNSTNIQVKIAASSLSNATDVAQIGIYDLRGRLVKEITEQSISAGDSQVIWDGKDSSGRPCPIGVYLVKCSLQDGVELVSKISLVE